MDKTKNEIGLQRITVLIPDELNYRTRLAALKKRATLTATVIAALEMYVSDSEAAQQADVRTFSGKE